jgi:3-hydroxyanthranilic acid dioxygenase
MDRRRTLDVLKAAQELGDYDDFPVLMAEVEPQLHVSRNSHPQPFFLICERDVVLVQMTGSATLKFRDSNVRSFRLESGDNVYVPARTPHQIVPITESVQVRYKPKTPGLEAVAWYCAACEQELFVATWDTGDTISQQAYWDACERFNADAGLRTCRSCTEVHATIDLSQFNWLNVAQMIRDAQTG